MEGQTGAVRMVEGVVYTSSNLAPGLVMFRCDRLSATLSIGGCTGRWAKAGTPVRKARRQSGEIGDDREPEIDRFAACRGCAIGAQHSGEEVTHYSAFFGASICPRCRMGTTRMIGARICIGCYNREREQALGRNARGNVPTKLVPLRTVQFRAVTDGRARLVRARQVVDMAEPMIQTLRTTPGLTVFSFAAPRLGLRQSEMFENMTPPRDRRTGRLNRSAGWRRPVRFTDTGRQGLLF